MTPDDVKSSPVITQASSVVASLRQALRERRRSTTAVAFLLVLAGVLISRGTPLWWFGGSLLLGALAVLRADWSGPLGELRQWAGCRRRWLGLSVRPSSLALELLYLSVIVYVGSVMMSDILTGERPVSHDHTVHYFKAWQLHEHFLSQGRLLGWSHRWFAGYPANYLYPIGTDLWVSFVYALFVGTLSFSQAYAAAFWLFHLFTGVAMYRFGRVVGGPHVGLIAALFVLTDMSEFRLGGWAYTVRYGVWPQALSLNFALLALCHLPGLAERRTLAPIGWFGLWSGLAILTHPVQLIFLVMLLVVVTLASSFAQGTRTPVVLFRLAAASLLSVVVSSVWLLPFLSSRRETSVMGVWWDSTYEIAKGLLDLTSLPGTLPYVLIFGIVALVVLLRTRRFILVFTALMALFVPAVSNSTFIDEFHLPSVAEAFTKVQFIRMSTMVKPFWFVLAGCFVVLLLQAATALARRVDLSDRAPDGLVQRGALVVVVALLSLPVVVPAAQAFWTSHVAKTLVTESTRQLLSDRRDLLQWLQRELPEQGFYRVGVFTGHNHDLLDIGTVIDKPIYKRGFTPCSNFIYKMRDKDRAILEAVNLRYAIAKKYLPKENFELLARFGRYRVYRFKHYRPEPFRILEGQGQVEVERFGDEEIVLDAAPGSRGKLRLNVSYFSRWRAYHDGEPVPMTLTYLEEAPEATGFMTVSLSPGRYRFVFERTLLDRVALPLSLFGLLVAAALVLVDRRRRGLVWLWRGFEAVQGRLARLSEPRFARLRMRALWTLAAACLLAGVALAEWRPAVASEELGDLTIERVRFDFLEGLSQARANIEYKDANHPCVRQGDRLVCRDEHGNVDNEKYIASSPATIKEYTMVRCIRARPEEDALLSLTFPRVPIGDAIVGYYGIERAGRLMSKKRPVDFQVYVGSKRAYQGATEKDNRMHWFNVPLEGIPERRAPVTFTVSARNISKRYFCFHAQMVDLK